MSNPTSPIALVRVRQYGGTYLAGAKIGNAKQVNASCTAGEKTAAKRAAAKAFGCNEDDVELKNAKPTCVTQTGIGKNLFWATQKTVNRKPAHSREMIRIPVFTGEQLAKLTTEQIAEMTSQPELQPAPLQIEEDLWNDWFPKVRAKKLPTPRHP